MFGVGSDLFPQPGVHSWSKAKGNDSPLPCVYGGHVELHMLTPCSLCSSPYTSLNSLLILCFPPKASLKAVSSGSPCLAWPRVPSPAFQCCLCTGPCCRAWLCNLNSLLRQALSIYVASEEIDTHITCPSSEEARDPNTSRTPPRKDT